MNKFFAISLLMPAIVIAAAASEKKITEHAQQHAISEKQITRQIKIKPHIDRSDLGYKKFFSTYYPEKLDITVNGKKVYELKGKDIQDQEVTIPVTGNKLEVEYSYEWDMITGKRTGLKKVEFDLKDNANKLDLKFDSWKKDNRIIIPQAQQKGAEKKLQ